MAAPESNRPRGLLHAVTILIVVVCFAAAIYSIVSAQTQPPPSPNGASATGSVDTITEFAKQIGGNWWAYAAAISMVSTLSMALVEFLKGVFDIRRLYHQQRLKSWVQGKAFYDLVFLAIGDWKSLDALCSQPIEKMMGEIQPAANIALDSPDQYPELYKFLTGTDAQVNGKDQAADDRRKHRERVTNPPPPLRAGEAPDPEARDASKARIRLANLVSRKLDAFQLRTQYYWDRGNQFAAIALSVGICLAALTQDGHVTGEKFLLGVVSGIVSPFVKDLASSLASFARK